MKGKIIITKLKLKTKIPIDLGLPKPYFFLVTYKNSNPWIRVLKTTEDKPVLVRVKQEDQLGNMLDVIIESEDQLDEIDKKFIIDRIRHELGTDEEMSILQKYKKHDLHLESAIKFNPGFRLYANSDPIETLVLLNFSQNTLIYDYGKIMNLFLKKHGQKLPWRPKIKYFPSNSKIAKIKFEKWNDLKIGNKAKFFSEFDEDTLEKIQTYTFYPIAKRGLDKLLEITGIGDFSARCLFTYCARRYEFPFLDTLVTEILSHKYDMSEVNRLTEFDSWIEKRWPEDPALVLHTLIQNYKYETSKP